MFIISTQVSYSSAANSPGSLKNSLMENMSIRMAQKSHAKNILTAMGAWEFFTGVFDIKQASFQAKPNPSSYKVFCQQFNLNPKHCIFVEDMSENLLPAADLGMQTVLIRTQSKRSMKYADDRRIHMQVDSVHELLEMKELKIT
ncbi:HAD-IA family hydrolase [Piscirickettsia litoralis]|uniref:HAD-IA family hydrolase n=1 Tax=Piscirickettsia litoralis TaxID=1891921 RepID=UPI000AC01DAB|nr:HAD-IA family hydrolase [Piscirickettsia litoralis]